MIGIVMKYFLVLFKLQLVFVEPIAIVLDAVNNLSDVASSFDYDCNVDKNIRSTWSNRISKCNADCSNYLVCRHYVSV